MSQFGLLKRKRFAPFFWTQFLGAFNDNVFKNAVVIMFAFAAASSAEADTLVNLGAGIFILPFFLFSAPAGQIADKFEKSGLMRRIKLLEIGVMCFAALGFALESTPLLLFVLFLMGTQSTLFGPVKYSILPQHLREEELIGGNGLVEMGTFVAILLGTIGGGVLIGIQPTGRWIVSGTVITIAIFGWLTSRGIPDAPAAAPSLKLKWNIVTESWRTIGFARENRTVFLSILGISWFWFYGALFLAQIPGYTRDVLGGSEAIVTVLLAAFSVGVGAGSLGCERLSGDKIEIGLVPFGAFGLTLFALDLFLASNGAAPLAAQGVGAFLSQWQSWRILADLVLIGVFGGFYIVPLYALVQHRSEVEVRSRIIAANNILNALFMVLAAVIAIALRSAGFTVVQLFLFAAAVNALVAVYIFTLVPEFLMRFLIWMLMHTVYRLKTTEIEHIPDEGPAVIVCNHVSFVDALIISAACRRPIRFVMYHLIFKIPVLNFIFRTARAIPIASAKEDEALMKKAFDDVAAALEAGELVGIFPEGEITRHGDLNAFRPGVEKIVERTPVPVVPSALRGLWGSFFSRKDGAAMQKVPRRFWSKIEYVCGPAVPATDVDARDLQERVAELRGDWR